ncbi:MAG: LysM peptidoglycan-binding domain-containing protein, partial [Bacteroidota bacterium]
HVFPLKGGETLAYKAYEVYGATNYYLQVAKANGLTSFRNVSEGRELVFPPIEKNPAGDS